jgi:hypothetical protein
MKRETRMMTKPSTVVTGMGRRTVRLSPAVLSATGDTIWVEASGRTMTGRRFVDNRQTSG